MSNTRKKLDGGVRINPNTDALVNDGDINIHSSDNKLKVRLNGSTKSVATEDQLGSGDVDVLSTITSFDSSSGLTTPTSGINGDTFRLTHAAGSTEFSQVDISLDDKWRNKVLELLLDVKTTAASGNFKVIVTDETNTKTLADEVITPQDADAKTSKRRFTFSTTPADGDSDIATIRVRFEALQESGSPTSDFDDIVVQLATTEVREIVAIEQEENVFSATISDTGSIDSQSSSFLSSVTKTGTGVYDVVFKSSFFSVVPSIQVSCIGGLGSFSAEVAVNPTTTGFTYRTFNNNGTPFDLEASFVVQRQGSDYRNLERRVEREVSTFKEILVSNSDVAFFASGNAGESLGAAADVPFATTSNNKGGGTFDGTTYTIPRDGLYTITSSIRQQNTNNNYRLFLNGSQIANFTTGQLSFQEFAQYNAEFSEGDQIKFVTAGAATLTNSASEHWFSVTSQGNLEVAQVAPDSKVEIPTSEIRIEDMTGKGTGSEATTVQFNSISKIRGNGVTVDNANGSVFTVQKDGILSVSASARQNVTYTLAISKNAASPASFPSESEVQSLDVNDGNLYTNVSATFKVSAGDVVRIAMDGSAPSNANYDFVEVLHQETKVQVAISNVTPQYEDADSMVRLHTTNGHGSTNTKIKRFSTVVDNIGSAITYVDSSTDGASFTIEEDGYYSISYGDAFTGASEMGISLNSTELTTNIRAITSADILAASQTAGADFSETVMWSGTLSAGDVVRAHTAGAAGSGAGITTAIFTIAKVGVPSIAEVDVTPFADVNRLERGNATFNGYAGYPSTKYNPYFSHVADQNLNGLGTLTNDSTNGCRFTALEDCHVVVSFNIATDGGGNDYCGLSRNGDNSSPFSTWSSSNKSDTLAYSYSGSISDRGVTWSGYLKAGDYILPHTNGAAPNPIDSMSFSISVEKDSRSTMYSVAQTENEFSARISNNGTAAIVSESQNFIESVSRTAAGKVTVNFKTDFFSVTPSANVSLIQNIDDTRTLHIQSISTSSMEVATGNGDGNTLLDYDFDLHVSRQGADRKDLQKAIVQIEDFPRVNRTISESVHFEATAGYGSTNTVIPYYTNELTNSVSSLGTIENNSTNGFSFTADRDCRVTASFTHNVDSGGADYYTGWSLNSNQLTTNIASITGSHRLIQEYYRDNALNASTSCTVSTSVVLKKGDVLRPHTDGVTLGSAASLCNLNLMVEGEELERVVNIDKAENTYVAKIQGSTGNILYENVSGWIDVTRNSAGDYTLDWQAGLFSEAPVVSLQPVTGSTTKSIADFKTGVTATTTSITINQNSFTGSQDLDFFVIAHRAGNDYKSIQDVVATVFTPKSAIVSEVQSNTVSSTTSLSASSFSTNTLNDIMGDSDFVSISSNQVTIQPGKYRISCTIPVYANAGAGVVTDMVARFRNITDSSTVRTSDGASCRADGNDIICNKLDIKAVFEITEAKTYEVQTRVSQTSGITIGRVASAGEDETYTQLEIVKIN